MCCPQTHVCDCQQGLNYFEATGSGKEREDEIIEGEQREVPSSTAGEGAECCVTCSEINTDASS